MKYLAEYRDPALARKLLDELHQTAAGPWKIMEACDGQTHALVRQGIDELLPAGIRMVHGPCCRARSRVSSGVAHTARKTTSRSGSPTARGTASMDVETTLPKAGAHQSHARAA